MFQRRLETFLPTAQSNINQWLVSGGAQAPRHLTARVLQQLPSRTPEVNDGLEGWFVAIAALSLLPVIAGIWFLADPAVLRHTIDTIGSAISGVSGVLLDPGTMLTTYVVIVVVGVMAAISLGLIEEG